MHITPARPRHLAAIHRMIRALSAHHGDTATITLEALQHALFDSGHASAFIACDAGGPLGYAGLTHMTVLHTGETRIDIHHLYVEAPHRARGVGRALVAAARDHAITLGATRLTIGTDPDNFGAQAAYRAMGLEEITGAGPRFRIPLEDQ